MDWVALDFPSIDATSGLRLINSHLEKNSPFINSHLEKKFANPLFSAHQTSRFLAHAHQP
jgi:hypothetical protein